MSSFSTDYTYYGSDTATNTTGFEIDGSFSGSGGQTGSWSLHKEGSGSGSVEVMTPTGSNWNLSCYVERSNALGSETSERDETQSDGTYDSTSTYTASAIGTYSLYRSGGYSNSSFSFGSVNISEQVTGQDRYQETGTNASYTSYTRDDSSSYSYTFTETTGGNYSQSSLQTITRNFDGDQAGGGSVHNSSVVTYGYSNSGTRGQGSGAVMLPDGGGMSAAGGIVGYGAGGRQRLGDFSGSERGASGTKDNNGRQQGGGGTNPPRPIAITAPGVGAPQGNVPGGKPPAIFSPGEKSSIEYWLKYIQQQHLTKEQMREILRQSYIRRMLEDLGLSSLDEIDGSKDSRTANVNEVILQLLKDHPEAYELLRKAKKAGITIELASGRFERQFWLIDRYSFDFNSKERKITLATTRLGVRSVKDVAEALYAALQSMNSKDGVAGWLSKLGDLFTKDIQTGLQMKEFASENEAFQELKEEWETDLAFSLSFTEEKITNEIRNQAIAWAGGKLFDVAREAAGALRGTKRVAAGRMALEEAAAAERKSIEKAAKQGKRISELTNRAKWKFVPPAESLMGKTWQAEGTRLLREFEGDIKFIDELRFDPVTKKPIFGGFDPMSGNIHLYRGADEATLFEELLHWKHLKQRMAKSKMSVETMKKLWGDPVTRKALYDSMEAQAIREMLAFGFQL